MDELGPLFAPSTFTRPWPAPTQYRSRERKRPMIATNIQIFLNEGGRSAVLAWVNITIENAVAIRDIKLIRRKDGGYMLAFPNKSYKISCPYCHTSIAITAKFCEECGREMERTPWPLDKRGVPYHSKDCAYPITKEVRDYLTEIVLSEYEYERKKILPIGLKELPQCS